MNKMMSKSKISKREKKKTNPELVEAIRSSKKNNPDLAKLLSTPTRRQINKNLDEISNKAKKETVIVPGKVLGRGEPPKNVRIIALSFSESAAEKLKKNKAKFSTISEELEKNKNNKLEEEILSG